MRKGAGRSCGIMVLCALLLVGICCPALAKIPEGYRDVRLGMDKPQVIELLKKSPVHFSYDDRGDEIGEIIRGDNLFRYATYKFNGQNRLVEIGLQMREVIGRDTVLRIYNKKYGLQISPHQRTVQDNRSIEVVGNGLIMRMDQVTDSRAAKGAP